ncbi:carbohydrate ABC transporter permease [Paenibacillus tritici]|uniref:Carbohydrate ABC transporter permease n=1 Tax=Paenibacillus tritici TaxID=1873425 RepID=A0ABX2DJ59_9BACL|nr:carbohydrate ABC transporter permease [Paenibacillus tritici]NQX44649.1 carbohydrate ABC transporter permease [Paenibacillus tritici]
MKSNRYANWAIQLLVWLGAGLMLFPLYLTVTVALKKPGEGGNIMTFPKEIYFGNFKQAVELGRYFEGLLNSTFITVISLFLIILFGASTAYGISRSHSKSSRLLYYFFISGMFVPFQVLMLPLLKQISAVGLLNKYGVILLYTTYSLFQSVFLYTGYLKSIPKELEEAAQVDGYGPFRLFWKIIFPLLKPMTATLIILNTIWIWNDFLLPLVMLSDPGEYTLPLLQYVFQTQYSTDFSLAFASYLLVMLPILLVYSGLQKYIINGIVSGAVK